MESVHQIRPMYKIQDGVQKRLMLIYHFMMKKFVQKILTDNRWVIHGFLEKLTEKNVHKLLPLKYLPDIIPVPSSECEGSFLQMNLIVTKT